MRGLLLKDAYIIGKLCKTVIFMDLIFIAASFLGGENTFFLFYPPIFSGMLPMTLISLDERDKWDKYAGGLPVTRAQLVSSKYLIGLFGSVIVLALISLAQGIEMSIKGSFSAEEYLFLLMLLLSVSFVVPAILYPFVFKFGVEKGRIFYYFIIGAACGGSIFLSKIDTGILSKLNGFFIMAMISVFCVLLYAASWLLSIHVYQKREL